MPTYEVIFGGKFGAEFVAGFDLSNDEFSAFTLENEQPPLFSASKFIPEFGGRYYTNSKQQGKGFFVGPYISYEILLSRDEELTDFLAVIDFSYSGPDILTRGLLSSSYGINFGYKWIFKKHWIIDINPTLVYRTQPFENISSGFDFDVDLKIGYRF